MNPSLRKKVVVIGVASGLGAADPGCQDSPEVLEDMGFLRDLEESSKDFAWDSIIHPADRQDGNALDAVVHIASRLADRVLSSLGSGHFPLVIGGDHSCAIGTWSGAQAYLAERGRLGLIWFDAHMDSHTFATSPSRAIHGMALACLLGVGETRLTEMVAPGPKLRPQDVCVIGVRSFEPEEDALLRQLGVRIYCMDEIRARGFAEVFREARALVGSGTAAYGISLDLDVLEPTEEPGVGTPVPGGILRDELITALRTLHGDDRLLAMEIVEYNPYRDKQFATAKAVHDLCQSIINE